jgi:hypothetical protein
MASHSNVATALDSASTLLLPAATAAVLAGSTFAAVSEP